MTEDKKRFPMTVNPVGIPWSMTSIAVAQPRSR